MGRYNRGADLGLSINPNDDFDGSLADDFGLIVRGRIGSVKEIPYMITVNRKAEAKRWAISGGVGATLEGRPTAIVVNSHSVSTSTGIGAFVRHLNSVCRPQFWQPMKVRIMIPTSTGFTQRELLTSGVASG